MTAPHLSPWIEAAPFVFISEQLPFDPSVQISSDDVSQQTTQALENLGSLLAKLGLAVHDVVKTTVWLRRDGDFAASMKATPRFSKMFVRRAQQ